MSRNVGDFIFPANFEVTKVEPLDGRQLVGTKADLTGVTTWNQSGGIWLFDGAIVAVGSDPIPENNGIYFLADATNYTNINSWSKVEGGSGTSILTGAINGLSLTSSGTTVVLGGALTGDTVIDTSGNTFSICHDLYGDNPSMELYFGGATGGWYFDQNNCAASIGLQPRAVCTVANNSSNAVCNSIQVMSAGSPASSGIRLNIRDNSQGIIITDSSTSTKHLARYADNYSASMIDPRMLPDIGYLTGYTQSAVTISSNTVDVCNVTTNYTATASNDFIGVSGATEISLPAIPKECQRITVVDIAGEGLSSPITIYGNGLCINRVDSIATINTNYGSMTFINNNCNGWSAVAFIN